MPWLFRTLLFFLLLPALQPLSHVVVVGSPLSTNATPLSVRYLTFYPKAKIPYVGFNNQRQVFRAAFILAYLLNRTLVIPPKLCSYHNYFCNDTDWALFFDLPRLAQLIPVTTELPFTAVPKHTRDVHGPDVRILPVSYKRSVITNIRRTDPEYSTILMPKVKVFERQAFRIAPIQPIHLDFFRNMTERVLHLPLVWCWCETLFVFTPSLYAHLIELEGRFLRFTPRITSVANSLVRKLPTSYDAIHLRIGDWPVQDMHRRVNSVAKYRQSGHLYVGIPVGSTIDYTPVKAFVHALHKDIQYLSILVDAIVFWINGKAADVCS